jgi:hypothetical protein
MLMFAADAFANRFSFLQWTSSGIACAAGAVPLWGYLLMNQKVFGMMLPVSAKAKELRFHHYPSLIPIKYVLIPTSLSIALLFLPALAVGIFAVVRLVHNRQVFAKQSVWPVAVALLVFPIIHLVAVSLISDWPLFLWYLYPFVLSIFGSAIAIVATSKYPARPAPLAVVRYSALGLFVMGSIYAMLFAWFRKPTDLYFSSTQIARFAETHPGTYAMGDRSGTVAFLISRPLIQLEGLTMDKQFLQRLRTGDDLTKVLRDYGVSYYIATEPELRGGCYVAVEPRQAGPDSVKMHGTLCARPVARFSRSGVEEDIFDVRGI